MYKGLQCTKLIINVSESRGVRLESDCTIVNGWTAMHSDV